MRNALIFTLILGVLVLGFLLIKAKNQNDTRVPWPETELATQTNNYQNTNTQTNTNNNQTQQNSGSQNTNQTYTYLNNEFGFAVDFPHTDVQRSTGGIGGSATIFSFFNQNERVATIHVWSDPSFVNQMKNEAWTFIGNINVNGYVFEQYSQTVDGSTSSNLYIVERDNLIYQIRVLSSNINNIFLIN